MQMDAAMEMVLRTEELMETTTVEMMEMTTVEMTEMTTGALMAMITGALMATIMVEQMEVLTIRTSNFSSLEPQPLNKETTCTTMLTLIVYKILTTQN
jgi:hypothetical protein